MKQVAGQIDIFSYLEKRKTSIFHCGSCVCKNCLYWWSSRCPYGKCFDDHRARIEPYEKVHPDRTPRKSWSNWDKQGEQAHWCRGGIFYPISYCGYFVKYEGSSIEDCVAAPVQTFQDGYINCSLKGYPELLSKKALLVTAAQNYDDIRLKKVAIPIAVKRISIGGLKRNFKTAIKSAKFMDSLLCGFFYFNLSQNKLNKQFLQKDLRNLIEILDNILDSWRK